MRAAGYGDAIDQSWHDRTSAFFAVSSSSPALRPDHYSYAGYFGYPFSNRVGNSTVSNSIAICPK
jgi:hypothetical protein